jgi:hypothetical protein
MAADIEGYLWEMAELVKIINGYLSKKLNREKDNG